MARSYDASTLTDKGAYALTVKINAYWRKLGLSAGAVVERQESEVDGQNSVKVVRSPMINGLPRDEFERRMHIANSRGFFRLAPLNLDVIPRPANTVTAL